MTNVSLNTPVRADTVGSLLRPDSLHAARRRFVERLTRLGLLDELVGARDELPRDRVGWIGRVDQRDELRRHRDRIARRHLFELGNGVDRREAGIDQLARLAQRRRQFRIDPVHGSPAGGVQTT